MDLKDFPHLKEMNLQWTAVTGDIRDIGENDFSSLEKLILPKGVYGGVGCKFQNISDANNLVRVAHLLKKQRQLEMRGWYGTLSRDSPDWYESVEENEPPFCVSFVEAASRTGYRWGPHLSFSNPCEVNWLDPAPDTGSEDYARYVRKAQRIEDEVTMYKGFFRPPTEEEYQRLVDGHFEERKHNESDDDSLWDLYNDNESDEEWLRHS